ncbi:MAG: hypothetical protein SGBAC_008543 [Bacillariaceae sp.]
MDVYESGEDWVVEEEDDGFYEVVVPTKITGWRTQAKLVVTERSSSWANDGCMFGLYKRGSHEVLEIPKCAVHHPSINLAVEALEKATAKVRTSAFSKDSREGGLRYVQLQVERSTGKISLTLIWAASELKYAQPALSRLTKELSKSFPQLWHSMWCHCNEGPGNNIFTRNGKNWYKLSGNEFVREPIAAGEFGWLYFTPLTFRQGNMDGFDILALDVAKSIPGEKFSERLKGATNNTLCDSPISTSEYDSDGDENKKDLTLGDIMKMMEEGKQVGDNRSGQKASYMVASAGEALKAGQALGAEVLVVDPPRKGLEEEVLQELCKPVNPNQPQVESPKVLTMADSLVNWTNDVQTLVYLQMEKAGDKRGDRVRARSEAEVGGSPEEPPTKKNPTYGSQQYWEDRYMTSHQKVEGHKRTEEDSPEALHAWYFTYEDLSPLLLPLILGNGKDEECEGDEIASRQPSGDAPNSHNCSDGNGSENAKTEEKKGNVTPEQQMFNLDNNSGGNGNATEYEVDGTDGDGSFGSESREDEVRDHVEVLDEEGESDDDDSEQPQRRDGLSKSGAISILEVGCGDVPLGRDLAKSIESFESQTGVPPSSIIEKMVCVDYAPSCIAALKKEGRPSANKIPICYEIGDARKLSYDDASFELILEKGTMDAMLSDSDEGVRNCNLIIAEFARLLSTGGCFVIVSHVNAHVPAGLQWLDNIVLPGLRMNCKHTKWEIEVHGNSGEDVRVENGETEEQESPGPAVYLIHKIESKKEATESDPPTIPLRFFSY